MSVTTIPATTTTTAGITITSISAKQPPPRSLLSLLQTFRRYSGDKYRDQHHSRNQRWDSRSPNIRPQDAVNRDPAANLITPVKAVKGLYRKRKAERPTHLISSPFKNMLQEKKQREREDNRTIVEERNRSKEETSNRTVAVLGMFR